jgi:hypothetical protein
MVSDAAVPLEPVGGKLVELLQTIVHALRHCLRASSVAHFFYLRAARVVNSPSIHTLCRHLHTTSTCAQALGGELWVESGPGGEGRSPPAGADRHWW